MARHCVKWVSGATWRLTKKGKGIRCAHGRVKSGPRKGRCRKRVVHRRKRKLVTAARQGRYIFHGR